MLECVPNVSVGRDATHDVDALTAACGRALLDRHVDPDHGRGVFTLAGPGADDAFPAARALATTVADRIDVRDCDGVHPRLGALDVVPFVSLDGERGHAADVAREFARWLVERCSVPVFFYDDADPAARPLPELRRDAFRSRPPDLGPAVPHPRLGATAVGARRPLVAVNCRLDRDDLAIARTIAARVRARDGGLPGVRALGFRLASRRAAQVSMNLVDLDRTGLEEACTEVARVARASGVGVAAVELVGLVPASVLARCTPAFLEATGIGSADTIEARLQGGPWAPRT